MEEQKQKGSAGKKRGMASLLIIVLCVAALCAVSFLLHRQGRYVKETFINDAGEKVTVQYVTRSSEDRYALFESALKEAGIEYTKDESGAAASIDGVTDGVRYCLADGRNVQIFRFDIQSEAYRKAVREGKLFMPSIGQTVNACIKDDYAMIPYNYEDIVALFEK